MPAARYPAFWGVWEGDRCGRTGLDFVRPAASRRACCTASTCGRGSCCSPLVLLDLTSQFLGYALALLGEVPADFFLAEALDGVLGFADGGAEVFRRFVHALDRAVELFLGVPKRSEQFVEAFDVLYLQPFAVGEL